MFVSKALAQSGSAPGSQGLIEFLLPLVLIFVVFYFLLIRPQQKKAKAHKEMVNSASRGDMVVTAGGIRGKVMKVDNDGYVSVEISPGVRVDALQATLADVVKKSDLSKISNKKNKNSDNSAQSDSNDDKITSDKD